MAVVFRGRLHPNIQRNPNEPLEIRFNRPRNRTGVTILIKELDTYKDTQNRQISEGSDDDLLATFTGDIRNYRFQVAEHRNESDDTTLPRIKIKFRGSATVYEIPVVAQEGENETANWEIAFTVQYPDQDDYVSPVAFIARSVGRILIVDNTMGDLTGYERHANLVRRMFVNRGMEGKIIRGAKSRPAIAYYSDADTEDFPGGFGFNEFTRRAGDYDYIYFNCHGDIELEGPLRGQFGSPCSLCRRRFLTHHRFRRCQIFVPCTFTEHRGFHRYELRTTDYEGIRLAGPVTPANDLRFALGEYEQRALVGRFVNWDEYEPKFYDTNHTADHNDANVTRVVDPPTVSSTGVAIPGDTHINVEVTGASHTFRFPTLIAFPTSAIRPDFRNDNLPQDPPSPSNAYIHHASAQDVPGVPVICFIGESGPLSAEITATPLATSPNPPEFGALVLGGAAPTPFATAPSGLTATVYKNQVELSWTEVTGADNYTIYWSTSAFADVEDARAIPNVVGTSYTHSGRTNGTTYHYRICARRAGGSMTPGKWGTILDMSRVKVIYAGCCLTGRKKVFADAALAAGANFFIGHQVVTAGVSENLINQFWRRWLNGGAILHNLINIFNSLLQSTPVYRRSRPVVYYRDTANQTQHWRHGMPIPNPSNIKLT